jgi:membrane-bound serine protease (ClpP class)
MSRVPWWLLLGILALAPGSVSARVNLITIDGSINPATDDFIRESIRATESDGGEALIIQLDTPGGLLTSTKSIVKAMLGAQVPIIVYVGPAGASATSAGVFVTLAAHVAVMAPGTTIGAAHPVSAGGGNIGGGGEDGSDMAEKVENFAVSFVQSIAERRGRNLQWAEDAVRKSVSITETEAVEKKVVDFVAADLPALLAQSAGRTVTLGDGEERTLAVGSETEIVPLEMSLKQRVLNLVADPNIAYLLFMAGLLGLYFEFSNPGTVFPGVAGGICLLLALTAFQVLPINATGILLILFGVALLLAEVFIPSFGVLGIGGITAFVLGSLLLFDTTDPGLVVNRGIVGAAALSVSSFMLAIGFLVLRTQWGRARTGSEGLVGEVGEVRERVAGTGKVFVHGEYWTAVSDETLEPGERVEVERMESGMRIRVRRATRG